MIVFGKQIRLVMQDHNKINFKLETISIYVKERLEHKHEHTAQTYDIDSRHLPFERFYCEVDGWLTAC